MEIWLGNRIDLMHDGYMHMKEWISFETKGECVDRIHGRGRVFVGRIASGIWRVGGRTIPSTIDLCAWIESRWV